MIMYFLYQLSDNPIYHWGVPVGVIAVELLAQYFLSLGKSKIKDKRYLQGAALIFVYVFYVLLFGVLSAVAFFAAEISVNTTKTDKAQQINTMAQKRYMQIDELIASLNLQMITEAKTGFGRNSQKLLNEIRRLETEQAALIDRMNETDQDVVSAVNSFSALAEILGVNDNMLAIVIFGSLILFIYIGLTVCNPDLEFGNETPSKDETKSKKRILKTIKNETAICPVCDKTFQRRNGKNYCSSNCRLKAFRRKEMITNG